MQRRHILLLFLMAFLVNPGWSQLNNQVFEDRLSLEPSDSGKLFAGVNAMGFLKNNEYTRTIIQGYTLFGFQLQPYLSLHVAKNLRLDAGAFLQKDFGNENFSTATPVFSLKWKSKDYSIIFGNIEGSLNHRLIEPLYDFERVLNRRLETGVQFQVIRENLFVDAWFDWQYMQYLNDPRQEQFVAGLSFQKRMLTIGSGSIHFPFQIMARHQGGQLDLAGLPIQTVVNSAVGVNWIQPFDGWIKQISLSGFYVYDKDITKSRQAYMDGDGGYANGAVTTSFGLEVMASYWKAREFMSFQGGRIYPAVSVFHPETIQPEPQLLIMRFMYDRKITDQLSLTLRYEPYYDFGFDTFQYSYGFYLNYRARYFLAKPIR